MMGVITWFSYQKNLVLVGSRSHTFKPHIKSFLYNVLTNLITSSKTRTNVMCADVQELLHNLRPGAGGRRVSKVEQAQKNQGRYEQGQTTQRSKAIDK